MSTTDVIRRRELPTVSFGPFRLLEAVPWLMLASAFRFASHGSATLAIPGIVLASVSLFLAFLLAARRMIEFADGRTELGTLSFGEQLLLARTVLRHTLVLLLVAVLVVYAAGARSVAPHMMMGFDGIAFDQFSKTGMIWSSILAAIVLLMVVKVGTDRPITMRETFLELWARANWLLPAIVAVAAMQFGLHVVQGWGRAAVYAYGISDAPLTVKNLVYFAFVFGFAALRLWLTLAILTLALRESYRQNAG